MRENTSIWQVLCRDREGFFGGWGICGVGGAGKAPTIMMKISQSELDREKGWEKRREYMEVLGGPGGRLDPNKMTYESMVGS